MKFIDSTGKKFGRLLVIKRAPNVGTSAAWHTLCDCGNKRIVVGQKLRSGHTKSCGCITTDRLKSMHKEIPVGSKFNKLTVIRKTNDRTKKQAVLWECLCDCGNTHTATSLDLHKNKVKSCGCLNTYRDEESRRAARRDTWRKWNVTNQNRHRKKRYHSDELFKLTISIRGRIRHAFKAKKWDKNRSTLSMIGIGIPEYKQYLESMFEKGMTWDNHGEWHIDHITPVSSAETKEELIKLFHYTNTQPLWAEDNLKKGSKLL